MSVRVIFRGAKCAASHELPYWWECRKYYPSEMELVAYMIETGLWWCLWLGMPLVLLGSWPHLQCCPAGVPLGVLDNCDCDCESALLGGRDAAELWGVRNSPFNTWLSWLFGLVLLTVNLCLNHSLTRFPLLGYKCSTHCWILGSTWIAPENAKSLWLL